MGENICKWSIFHSHVKLPEGSNLVSPPKQNRKTSYSLTILGRICSLGKRRTVSIKAQGGGCYGISDQGPQFLGYPVTDNHPILLGNIHIFFVNIINIISPFF